MAANPTALREPGVDDESLTTRLSRDLDGVFADVVFHFEAAVFTTALRLTDRREEAEDLAAETFLRAFSALRRYPPLRIVDLQLRPWLITICLNVWRNQVRAASRRAAQAPQREPPASSPPQLGQAPARPRPELGRTPASSPSPHPPEPMSADESPEDRAERHDEADQLAAALMHLPAKQRIAVVLHHIVGLSYAEVAEVLACPDSTAKSHVRRGLEQARTLLTADHKESL